MEELMKGYYDYLEDETEFKQIGEWIVVSTPFLDRSNDCIEFYIKEDIEGNIHMTDDGWTINIMYLNDDEVRENRMIQSIIKSNGVSMDGNALVKTTTKEKFNVDMHFYLTCLMQLNVM